MRSLVDQIPALRRVYLGAPTVISRRRSFFLVSEGCGRVDRVASAAASAAECCADVHVSAGADAADEPRAAAAAGGQEHAAHVAPA
jgi:hypothetical protein